MSVALKIEGPSHGPSHSPTISRVPSDDQEVEVNTELEIESSPITSALQNFIPRVPQKFREIGENKGCYDPMVVSIGPYHHGDKKLEKMEEFKAVCIRRFASEMENEMYRKVRGLLNHARRCYAEDLNQIPDEVFIRMMVHDGFFIIHFISCEPEELDMTTEEAASVTRDLFLLENQLPIRILVSLMRLNFPYEDRLKELFEDLFTHIRAIPHQEKYSYKEMMSTIYGRRRLSKRLIPEFQMLSGNQPNFDGHLLQLFHLIFVKEKEIPFSGSRTRWYQREKSWKWFYPVKELKKVGISSEAKQHHPEDVKRLRSKGILLTTIESHDDQVAKLFNEIATNLVDDPVVLSSVKNAIKSHVGSPFWQRIRRYKGPVSAAVQRDITQVWASAAAQMPPDLNIET
ncbi:unnamed protein product [Dovyalis caffra]|uniref:Uncharacterized protein n=1 Tax=Dovyalis caffra TaxID=77055 RepID=A0AAV1QQW1_9ROSI|nr:unnamed protein product [Dovyalis caffra]